MIEKNNFLRLFKPRDDCKRACFDQLHAHILERQQIASALRCVRSADQNMAAHNRPLIQTMKECIAKFIDKAEVFFLTKPLKDRSARCAEIDVLVSFLKQFFEINTNGTIFFKSPNLAFTYQR